MYRCSVAKCLAPFFFFPRGFISPANYQDAKVFSWQGKSIYLRFIFALNIDFFLFFCIYGFRFYLCTVSDNISGGVFITNLRDTALELSGSHGRKYLIPFPDKLDEISFIMKFTLPMNMTYVQTHGFIFMIFKTLFYVAHGWDNHLQVSEYSDCCRV